MDGYSVFTVIVTAPTLFAAIVRASLEVDFFEPKDEQF